MTNDYATKEKAFLESLKADTGRDLDEWMTAIAAQNLAHRNDIIDWLRHQGFIFSRASWLERIHHNGGRPVYLNETPPNRPTERNTRRPALRIVASNPDVSPLKSRTDVRPVPKMTTVPTPSNNATTGAHKEPSPAPSAPPPAPSLTNHAEKIFETIAKAKAFEPLARHALNELTGAIPGVVLTAKRAHVAFANPDVFAAIVVTPKGLRLCLDLGSHDYTPPLIKTRVPNPIVRLPKNLTHMILLDDARQIDAALIDLVKAANQQVNGQNPRSTA